MDADGEPDEIEGDIDADYNNPSTEDPCVGSRGEEVHGCRDCQE